jgi:hypothetical protein
MARLVILNAAKLEANRKRYLASLTQCEELKALHESIEQRRQADLARFHQTGSLAGDRQRGIERTPSDGT